MPPRVPPLACHQADTEPFLVSKRGAPAEKIQRPGPELVSPRAQGEECFHDELRDARPASADPGAASLIAALAR